MSETMGSLVDRLTVVNLKLWHVQARVHEAAATGSGLDADTVAKLHNLNLQRNRLMTSIDVMLDDSIKAGRAEIDHRPKFL